MNDSWLTYCKSDKIFLKCIYCINRGILYALYEKETKLRSNKTTDLPIVAALSAIGRRSCVINLLASTRISIMLLIQANNGANGNAAQNIVRKPNWRTADSKSCISLYFVTTVVVQNVQSKSAVYCSIECPK